MDAGVKNRILQAAMPYIKDRRVKDIVVGISLVACQLDDGSIGVTYVLREGLPPECGAFGFAAKLIGAGAEETAKLYVEGTDNIRRAIGAAVINAAVNTEHLSNDDSGDDFGICPEEKDVVGMVGLIKPVAEVLEGRVGKLVVFDAGVSCFYGDDRVYPNELQPELLPRCSKVIITGSSTINGSIDELLDMCKNAEKVVIVGSSTPMLPQGWKDTPVTELAGSYWKKDCKEEIFRSISLGGGIAQLKGYSVKKLIHL